MKDEIKEIELDHFNNINELKQNVETWIKEDEMYWERWFSLYDLKALLDYITNLQEEKDKQLDKYKNVIDKIKEKGIMYYDPEYSKIYGELCNIPGANNTRTPVIVVDDEILELLEEVE